MVRRSTAAKAIRRVLKGPNKSLASKVKRLSKTVRRLKPETKHYDFTQQSFSVTNDGTTAPIGITTAITQGDSDFGERVGDRIIQKRLQVRGAIFLPAAAGAEMCRITIFSIKNNPDGATSITTAWNEYILSVSNNTAWAPMHLKDWDNSSNFITHYDKVFALNNASNVVTAVWRPVIINLNLKNRKTQYYNNGATVAKNDLYMVVTSVGDGVATFYHNTRFTYTDP